MISEKNKRKVVLKDYSMDRYLPTTPQYVNAYMVTHNQQTMYAIPVEELGVLPPIPSYTYVHGYYLVLPEHVFTLDEASMLLADRNHEQMKEVETMKQLYVRLSGEVLVGRVFTHYKWYPVTINDPSGLVGYIVDEEGQPYLLDLYRLPKNPAWISQIVDVSLPCLLFDN